MNTHKKLVERAWRNRRLISDPAVVQAIRSTIEELNNGTLRIATKRVRAYTVEQWIMKAVCLYFKIPQRASSVLLGPFQWFPKIPLKDYGMKSPPRVEYATVRHGSYIHHSAIIMPSFINVGAYIDEETMIDTWATIGSGAQIGKRVHISGGVGIGGILEPLQKSPVIIGDGCFIGSRCIITEGMCIGDGAIISQGVSLNQSINIYEQLDTMDTPRLLRRGYIPKNAVVIPGSMPRGKGPMHTQCALIVKYRDAKTDAKTALNDLLR